MTNIYVAAMSEALKTWQEVIEKVAQDTSVESVEPKEESWFDELPETDIPSTVGGWLDGLGTE